MISETTDLMDLVDQIGLSTWESKLFNLFSCKFKQRCLKLVVLCF
jgi:hypothetical protein